MNALLALLAGLGLGVCLGLLFGRWDQSKMFALVAQTSDSLVRSALFPGLSKEVFQPPPPEPAEALFDSDDQDRVTPDWMRSETGPWDMTEEPVAP